MAELAERKTWAVCYNRLLVLWMLSQMLHTAVGVLSVLGENTPFLQHRLLCLLQHVQNVRIGISNYPTIL